MFPNRKGPSMHDINMSVESRISSSLGLGVRHKESEIKICPTGAPQQQRSLDSPSTGLTRWLVAAQVCG